jgi:hypothetical protein
MDVNYFSLKKSESKSTTDTTKLNTHNRKSRTKKTFDGMRLVLRVGCSASFMGTGIFGRL